MRSPESLVVTRPQQPGLWIDGRRRQELVRATDSLFGVDLFHVPDAESRPEVGVECRDADILREIEACRAPQHVDGSSPVACRSIHRDDWIRRDAALRLRWDARA